MPFKAPELRPLHLPSVADGRAMARRDADRTRRARAPWRKLYDTGRWAAMRRRQLAVEPLCAMCARAGRVEAASVVDHVTPHRGDVGLFFGGVLQSLCAPCHDRDKQRQEARGEQ
jgi:5-methylcytosine-specific restriction endonuclease McrA